MRSLGATRTLVLIDGSAVMNSSPTGLGAPIEMVLQNPMMMTGFNRQNLPTGAFTVSMALPANARVTGVRLLESGQTPQSRQEGGRFVVDVPKVVIHEVVAVDLA